MKKTEQKLIEEFQNDFYAAKDYFNVLDEREKFLLSEPVDSNEGTAYSRIVDPTLLSSLIRRTNDVLARIPTGNVKVISTKDKGKGAILNLILTSYIIPNANTQYPLFIKLWMMEFLSLLYGKIDVLVDYVIKEDYVGPDFYIIPPRLGIPEAGAVSIDDASRYWVRSFVSPSWLEKRKKLKNWKNIDKLLEKSKNKKRDTDEDKTSYGERKYPEILSRANQIELITKYEKDKWTTFSAEEELILREIENPHKNGELPIVSKICYPLLDRYWGLSEYERLSPLHKALSTILNLGIDSQKMALYPPLKIYLPDIVAKTLKYEAGAKWILKNNNPNAITQHQFSPTSTNVFQLLYSLTKSALFSALGSTDTTIPSGFEPAMGKTPQALQIQQSMIATHTSFERKMLEQAIERIFDKFLDLLITKQDKPIELSLFKEEIENVKRINPDIGEMFDEENGKIIIKPVDVKNIKFKFYINTGTTMAQDKIVENQNLTAVLSLLLKLPNIQQSIATGQPLKLGNQIVKLGEIFKRWLATAGIEGWEKMIIEEEDTVQPAQQQPQEQLQQYTTSNFEDIYSKLPKDQAQLLDEVLKQYGQPSTTNQL